MGVTLPAQSGLLKPAQLGATSTVEGYNPKIHDPFFDGVSDQLADKGFVLAAAEGSDEQIDAEGSHGEPTDGDRDRDRVIRSRRRRLHDLGRRRSRRANFWCRRLK